MRLLRFEDLHKSYGETVALKGVSFEVRTAEVFGLLGPNGAGKTTLIRILMDILRPDRGSIELFGEPHRPDLLDRVGYLPEERGLYLKQKVLDVMTYLGSLKGLARAEAARRSRVWLRRFGLEETASSKVERLSKGMAQKVQLAATLMMEPPLCVLDEPFAGLDPLSVRQVQDLIRERRDAGLATILSTHQMNMVEALCDRIVLIHAGVQVVYGEIADVRARWSRPEVRVRVRGALPQARDVEEAVAEGDSTWRLRLRPGADAADVLADLVRAGARVDGFERLVAPMEEIFIRVVQGEPS